jgi:putative ABC transport system permease protein
VGPWSYTLAELRRRPGRALLALLGVAVSVATVAATATASGTVRRAYRDLFAGTDDAAGRSELARATLLSVEQGLAGLGVVAAVTAGLVLLNVFLLGLSERKRSLATLRAVGATRAQVRGLLLREATLLGLAGSVLGVAAGLALAVALTAALGRFMGVALPRPAPSAAALLPAALLGPVVALAAAWLPARRAARLPPLQELLDKPDDHAQSLPSWTAPLGGLLLALAGAAVVAVARCRLPRPLGTALLLPVVGLLAAGSALVLPTVAAALLRLGDRLARPRLGVSGTLALGQLLRRPSRTGLTAGALFVALVMAIAFGQVLSDTRADLRAWYRRAIPADYLVRAAMPDTAFLLAPALPEALGDEVAGLEGVARVDRIAFVPARAEGRQVLVLARTFAPDGPPPLDVRAGDPAEVLRRARAGEAVLDTGLARALGLGAGDTLRLETPTGPRPLRVAGTAVEYAVGGQALYLEWGAARRLLPLPGAHVFLVTARPGAAAGRALRAYCVRRGLLLQANDELRAWIDGRLRRVTAALAALLSLAFVVAALGVACALAMGMRQQRRELAVLRAVGMTRRQVLRVVLGQALLLGLVAAGPGAVAGTGLAWLLERLTNALSGRQVAFQFDVGLVGGACGLTVLASLLAALAPAVRAARARGLRGLTS